MRTDDERWSLKWGVERRLEFIEFRLFWEGAINRSDLMGHFGISVAQASKDLALYQDIAPDNLEYDKSRKQYVAVDNFRPFFLRPTADLYLDQLRTEADRVMDQGNGWTSRGIDYDVLRLPHRRVVPSVLRQVLRAISQKHTVTVVYQSMSRPNPIARRISPHALAFDGQRWHARAYCHERKHFRDFLLSRMSEIGKHEPCDVDSSDDQSWHEFVSFTIMPNPELTEDQQIAVSKDFGMDDGQLEISLRLALLYYLLRRLDLSTDKPNRPPREQHVILADPDHVRELEHRAN